MKQHAAGCPSFDAGRRLGWEGMEELHDSSPAVGSFEAGFVVGILVGEGHFGGDGRQPQVTLRMHTDHEALFRWLVAHIPGSRLYGPYHHAGRSYFQWMARGACLRERLIPILEEHLTPSLDERAWRRFQQMRADYRV